MNDLARTRRAADHLVGDRDIDPGLDHARLNGPSQPVRFALVREAGRLDCSGNAGNARGSGTCAFSADAAFAARLAEAGIGRPTERQAYNLTLAKVGQELIDELGRHGYERPDIDGLVSMGIHGVTASYVRDIASAGYRLGKAEGLVKFRIFGIDARFIGDMAAIGPQFRSLSAEDLVQFKIFGVKPDLVRAYSELGYATLDARDLVKIDSIVALKDSTRDLYQMGETIYAVGETLAVFAGLEPYIMSNVHRGAVGTVSMMGNVCGPDMVEYFNLCAAGRWEEAKGPQKVVDQLYHLLANAGAPRRGMKCAVGSPSLISVTSNTASRAATMWSQ